MAPNFKKWIWGIILASTGFSGLLGILVYKIGNPIQLTGMEALAALGFAALAFLGGFFYSSQLDRQAWLAYRWSKLGIGSWEDFPFHTALRQARVKSGWAEQVLGKFAHLASIWKERRETAQIELEKLYENVGTPEEQRNLKNKPNELAVDYRAKAEWADEFFSEYFRVWKLFETMDMLPIDPRTSEPWSNPEAFRKYMHKAQAAVQPENVPPVEVMA